MIQSTRPRGIVTTGLEWRSKAWQCARAGLTRPSALGMSDPIWGLLIHISVDEKKKCEG